MYTYTEPGNYACATNAVAATLKNCPLSTAFDLKVYRSAGGKTDGYIIQEYTAHDAKQRVLVPYDPYTSGTKWGNPITFATKSDLDLKLNNTSIFVGNGEDFGQAIKNAGIIKLSRVGFFICNNPSNSPLGNGFIILAHNQGYWNNHPMYIQINASNISCGTLNCSDYTNIKKD